MIRILHGDSSELLKSFSDNEFTGIITDPPYGIAMHNKKWDYSVPGRRLWEECLRVTKPGGHLLCFGGTRTYHRVAVEIEDAGWQIKDCIMWLYATGFPKSNNFYKKMPGLEGRYWSGFGSALKPAWEPILLAMKPNEGSFISNARLHGVAGINIDDTRIPTNENLGRRKMVKREEDYFKGLRAEGQFFDNSKGKGRWPSNVMLSHHEDCMQTGVKKVRTGGKSRKRVVKKGRGTFFNLAADKKSGSGGRRQAYGDSSGLESVGTWKCHQDCPVRHLGLQSSKTKVGVTKVRDETDSYAASASRFYFCTKPGRKERAENHHPTVKPVELMSYLVKMIKMPQGTKILEPFAGSGTTLAACMAMGVDCIGIEREAEYVGLIKRRLGLL